MENVLVYLYQQLWLLNFLALAALFMLALKQRQSNSTVSTVAIVMLMGGIILQYEDLVLGLPSPHEGRATLWLWAGVYVLLDAVIVLGLWHLMRPWRHNSVRRRTKGLCIAMICAVGALIVDNQVRSLLFDDTQEAYRYWWRMLYFLGAVAIYCGSVFAIHQAHKIQRFRYQFVAKLYLLAYLWVALLQIARFLERSLWQTDVLGGVYAWGMVAVNVITTSAVMAITLLACHKAIRRPEQMKEAGQWNL